MALSKSKAKKAAEDAAAKEERKFMAVDASGEVEKSDEGHQQELWCKIRMLRQ